MASRPKQAAPRPAPRLYLVTPPIAEPSEFFPWLMAALDAGDVAAVLLRLADTDERTLINHRIGTIRPGAFADLVILDREMRVRLTIVSGRVVYRR